MTTADDLVTRAAAQVRAITVDEVAAALERGAVILVDVREIEEGGRDGIIPGALRAPRGVLEFWADPLDGGCRLFVPSEAEIVVYSRTGRRSALAAGMLQSLGYVNVAHLDGGIRAWADAGRPVTRRFGEPSAAVFDAGRMGCADGLPIAFREHIQRIDVGESLRTIARDSSAREELPAMARLLGHDVGPVERHEDGTVTVVVVRTH
jgi:rhodanese-related sulfurtransferase/TusA-related sulfurtransferase